MTKSEYEIALEKIKFNLFSTKKEKELLKADHLSESNFFIVFNRMVELDCFQMQLDFSDKHFYIITNELKFMNDNPELFPEDDYIPLNPKTSEPFPFF